MNRPVPLRWALVAGALLASQAAAQQTPPTAILQGIVYDSLEGKPLAGAEVLLDGGVATARAGADGRFSLRAAPGEHTVDFLHPSLSAWGLLRHPLSVRLEAERTVSVTLATASRETILGRTCGSSGALVGGLVRDLLTLVPLSSSTVRLDADGGPGPSGLLVTTTGDGSWFACVERADVAVDAQARFGEARGRSVRIGPGDVVRVRDLYVQASEPSAVEGLVLDGQTGAPLADAAVEVVGTRLRTLTGDNGAFRFRGVPPGAVRLAVERIGYGRRTAIVRVEGGASARVTLELFAEAIALDSVVVTVEGGIADRNRLPTRFDGLSRADIDRLLPRAMGVDDLLANANVPGLIVRQVRYMRDSGVEEDGLCVELARRVSTGDRTCRMVEVYLNDVRLPNAEIMLTMLSPASIDRIQILSSSQASIQYMGSPRSQNGIVLIWTRR